MRRGAIAAVVLAGCGPDLAATQDSAADTGTATSSSETTITGEMPSDVSANADTTTTGDVGTGCAAPLECGDDCLQWEWVLQTFGDDQIDDVALAPDGTIVATAQRGAEGGALGDAVLVVLGADGVELRTDVLFQGLGDPDQRFVVDVAIGPDGRVGVLGQLLETPDAPNTMVVELHGVDGALAQRDQLVDDGSGCRSGALAFVADGGLLVAGVCNGEGVLRKYGAELVQAWEQRGDLPAGLVAIDLFEPIGADVIVGGATSDRFGLARLRPDGSAAWNVQQPIPELEYGMLRDLAVMPEGDVIAVGARYNPDGTRWVGRFDGAGAGLLWSRVHASSTYDVGWGFVGVVVDEKGRVFVTGQGDVLELDGDGEIVGCWQHDTSGGHLPPDMHAIAGSAELGLILTGSGHDVDRYGLVARLVP